MTVSKNSNGSFLINDIRTKELEFICKALENADLPVKRVLYELTKEIKSHIT